MRELLFGSIKLPVLFVGIGNTLKGDDGAGVELIGKLRASGFQNRKDITIMDCGQSPENFINAITASNAGTIVLVDAAALAGPAGSFELFETESIAGLSCSTHSMPLSMLSEMIAARSGKKVFLLGIQPKELGFGEGLSTEVEKGLDELVEIIKCMNWE